MKKWILGLLFVGSLSWAVTTQPHSIGIVKAVIESKTIAQINVYVPQSVGQLVFCSDCVQSLICVSSGTSSGAWVVSSSSHTSGTFASMAHCK